MRSFLYTPRGERIGLLALLLLCLLIWYIPRLVPSLDEGPPTDFSALQAAVADWEAEEAIDIGRPNAAGAHAAVQANASPFDPNQATEEQLIAAGLRPRASRAWLSYLEKGGRFRDWEAVERFRALNDQERDGLRSLLVFPETRSGEQQSGAVATATDLAPFDPNTVREETLISFGLTERVAATWIKFREGGFRFQKVQDLERVYGLSSADIERLAPFVSIPEEMMASAETEVSSEPTTYEAATPRVIIDINQATAEDWQQLRGIGPAYSRRIVNFRDKLGGFVSVDQVGQTYNLPDSTFEAIYLQLRPSPIFRQIAINTADATTLAEHPYLSWQAARAIVAYRDQHGRYSSLRDLEKLYSLSAETRQRIGPYLRFE